LEELERIDAATVVAQKILSAVARVGQRWGIGHVTDVLVGRATPQVTGRRHHELSTFGLMKAHPIAEVRAYLEQLTAQDYLQRTGDEYPVISLTPQGVALLKNRSGSDEVVLYRQRRPVLVRDRRIPASPSDRDSWEGVDRDLFERLRLLRLQIARERGVPPYVIFHDSTLREMARLRPGNLDELRQVRGIGARKAEDLGPAFLAVLAADPS
jgi:ATP-dependent DNA helicase RecQ